MATTTNRTVSFDTDVLARAQQAAENADTNLSAYVNRAVRKQVMIDNCRRAAAWLDNLPDEDKAALEALRRDGAERLAELARQDNAA